MEEGHFTPEEEKRRVPRTCIDGRETYWKPKIDAAIATAMVTPEAKDRVVEELSGAIAKLEQEAIRDPLTGLLNRGTGMLLLNQEIKLAQKHNLSLGLIFLDLDYFKRINDEFGHDAGDEALKKVSGLIEETVPDGQVFRYGGEEIAVILPDIDKEKAVGLGNLIGTAVKQRLAHETGLEAKGAGQVTVSMGISVLGETGNLHETLGEFVKRADGLMYEAKQAGRDRMGVTGENGQAETRPYGVAV